MKTIGTLAVATGLLAILLGSGVVRGEDYDGCGRLEDWGEDCVLFRTFGAHDFYVLDDYGEFQPWDVVRVIGTLVDDCTTNCDFYTGCVLDNTISDECEIDFADCGWLIQGVECVLFDSDTYGLYELEDYAEYGVGDRVYVTGIRDPYCISSCMQGDGCIVENTISGEGTPTEEETWGQIKSYYR
jgi:hypothetical protein